jgi:glycosyltransferase involved in cell wall biosynthesis
MSNKNLLLSLILPVFNEEGNLEWHHKKITSALADADYKYEVLYVNDGSQDKSLDIIKQLAKDDSHVRYISFSRNFGKEASTTAGLGAARGDAALILDADGQHPIELADEFVAKWQEGYQLVIGVRDSNTNEGFVKRYGSQLFYRLLNTLSDDETIPNSTDFRLLDRRVIDEFNKLSEHNRITRGLIDWLGFRRTTVVFDAAARHTGRASYGFTKLVRLAIHAFVSQTTLPLQLAGILGALTTLLSAVTGLFLIVESYVLGDPLHFAVRGTALLALFVSFLVGLVLICQWLLALYIESIHNETQNRPLYVVDETNE